MQDVLNAVNATLRSEWAPTALAEWIDRHFHCFEGRDERACDLMADLEFLIEKNQGRNPLGPIARLADSYVLRCLSSSAA